MRQSLRRISIVACVVGAALFGVSQTSAIAAEEALPAAAPASAPEEGGEVSLDNTGSPDQPELSAAAVCLFKTVGDYVHVSSSAFEASGHGWWVNGDCPTASAVVTVQLQQYYSDGKWRNVGTKGKETVRSGGGAGHRATGRAGCNSSAVTGWRSVVDVDLVGLADDPGKLTTPTRNINCRR